MPESPPRCSRGRAAATGISRAARADSALTAGTTAVLHDEYRAGKEQILAALALDGGLNRKARVAEETRLLGDIAAAGASFDSAFYWYGLSSGDFRGLADRSGVRDITLRVAALHRKMGEERKAFTMYVEALRLARVFHDDEGARDIQWAMLPCAQALDENEEESDIIRELLETYTASADVAHQAAVFLASGDGKLVRRSFDRGAEDYLRALMLADQAHDSLLAVRATLRLAMALEGAGRLRDALTNYGECLKRADRTRGAADMRLEALVRVGNLYLRGRQFAEAVRFFRAALSSAHAMGNSAGEAYLNLQLGNCDVETSRESALRSYRAGSDLFKTIGSAQGQAYASLCIGNLFLRNNQPTDALQYFKRGIEQSESVAATRPDDDLFRACEQAYFGPRRTPLYDEAIDMLLQLGRYDEAFWYADRRNSRELVSVLGALDPRAHDDSLRALLDAFADARAREIGAERRCLEIASRGGGAVDIAPEAPRRTGESIRGHERGSRGGRQEKQGVRTLCPGRQRKHCRGGKSAPSGDGARRAHRDAPIPLRVCCDRRHVPASTFRRLKRTGCSISRRNSSTCSVSVKCLPIPPARSSPPSTRACGS